MPDERIGRLVTAAERLNRASDDLTTEVRKINVSLGKLNLGIAATVPVPQTDLALGYGKVDGKWGLFIEAPDGTWVYEGAPRAHRVKAIAAVPALIDALDAAAQTAISEVEQASTTARMIGDVIHETENG